MSPDLHSRNVSVCAEKLKSAFAGEIPVLAIILGSGLGGLAARIENPLRLAYADLPGFPILTVAGHVGEILVGRLGGRKILAFKGRKHFYETDDAYPLKTMIRSIKVSGIKKLFISNAAGALNTSFRPGELMMITDHINYMGCNPLVGTNDDDFGPRFPPMGDAWNEDLRHLLKKSAQEQKINLHEGVYVAFRGPNFETPAEIRMAQKMGGDAVGMSSVPDCLIARHCGLDVVGCSMITNMGAGLSDEKLSHDHTLQNAAKGAADFEKLVAAFVEKL